jgi:hypothetical protein
MSVINWYQQGLNGPSTFAAAGPAETIVENSPQPGQFTVQTTISGGVILGSPSGPPIADPVLYGTASKFGNVDPDPSLQDTITISFDEPIQNFKVQIFNRLSNAAKYMVTDNVGDPAVIISLTANGSTTGGNSDLAILPTTNGATKIMITPVGTGPWDFFIDNITFNYNKGEEARVTELVHATTSQVFSLATTLSTLANVMLQLGIDPSAALLFAFAQACILDLNSLATDAATEADVEAAAAPAEAPSFCERGVRP